MRQVGLGRNLGVMTTPWPGPYDPAWEGALHALHLRTQVVGKLRMALTPPQNHWWHVPLYLCARGLTTSPIIWRGRTVEAVFDLLADELRVSCDSGEVRVVPLQAMSTADFYHAALRAFAELGVEASIWPVPVEMADPVPFEADTVLRPYAPAASRWLLEVLLRTQEVMQAWRGDFLGKTSPIHFFWAASTWP